ncbi:MAG: GNAT family N-acetyltransferase [Nitrospirota bacterium]
MLNRKFVIKKYGEEDIPGILELFSLSFGKEASEEWFVWKYARAPWSSRGYVVRHNGMVAAFYGGLRFRFMFRNRELWAYQFCDVMTHRKYRTKLFGRNPLVIEIAKVFDKENAMDFAFGFPSERHARLQTMMMGATSYRRLTVFRKELSVVSRFSRVRCRVRIGWDTINDAETDALWERSARATELSIVKDSAFLRWRYRENPAGEYQAVVFKGLLSRSIKALAVIKITGEELQIADFLLPEQGMHGIFLKAVERIAADRQVKAIVTWANSSEPVARSLIASGYRAQEGIPFGVRIIDEAKMREQDFYEKYSYRMGDYDAS